MPSCSPAGRTVSDPLCCDLGLGSTQKSPLLSSGQKQTVSVSRDSGSNFEWWPITGRLAAGAGWDLKTWPSINHIQISIPLNASPKSSPHFSTRLILIWTDEASVLFVIL